MLANTSVAEVTVETVAQKVKKIKTAEAAATETTTEMSVTEKVLNKIETLTDNFKAESDKPSATVLPETAQTNNPVNKLKSVEKFKICSLGNNYNISNYEFTKEQQIDQATTLITYKAQEESHYNCEVEVISENSQDVSLKCWKGIKTNINLSVFKLSYFVGDGFLFSQAEKNRLVLVKPVELGTVNTCPKNFKPVAEQKQPVVKTSTDSGLAGLTF